MVTSLFGISILTRIIMVLLAQHEVVNIQKMGEFRSVSVEFWLAIICDMVPYFFCLIQHIYNFDVSMESKSSHESQAT